MYCNIVKINHTSSTVTVCKAASLNVWFEKYLWCHRAPYFLHIKKSTSPELRLQIGLRLKFRIFSSSKIDLVQTPYTLPIFSLYPLHILLIFVQKNFPPFSFHKYSMENIWKLDMCLWNTDVPSGNKVLHFDLPHPRGMLCQWSVSNS